MPIRLKRAYDKPSKNDGYRVLVDRVWPRGVSKEDAELDEWMKEAAPSTSLRKWFGHDPDKWEEFSRRYYKELDKNSESLKPLVQRAKKGRITLVYGSKEARYNNAVALKEYLEKD
jgi:uncharacterized protein YeaO (DUF488 family)